MRRSGFKQNKPRKPLKRSKLAKQGKQPISRIQRKIWELCRQIATILYPSDCYTCARTNLTGSNRQLGHLWAKASLGAFLKYDIRILRWQCYNCNINRGGAGADFYARLLQEKGQDFMNQLQEDRKISVNAYDFYVGLLGRYERYLAELESDLQADNNIVK